MEKRVLFFCTVILLLCGPVVLFAETAYLKTSIGEIEHNPSAFYEKDVEVKASFYKEDDLWVQSIPNAKDYIGFFVTKPSGSGVSSIGSEYFGFVFAPKEMKTQIRLLKQGEKLTLRGKCFQFKSISIDGPGIEVSELLSGWGEEAKLLVEPVSVAVQETIKSVSPPPAERIERGKYHLFLNGKEYQGLRFGDDYLFEGVRFRVEKEERSKER